MSKSPPAFDNFTLAFGEYMKSGDADSLSSYCDSDANVDLFNIYRNGFYRACIDALVSNYPAIVALLGDSYFRAIARVYVTFGLPESGTLVGYGAGFPEFLEMSSISRNIAYLGDLARLDRAWLKVYFSAENTPLTPAGIAELENEGEIELERIVPIASIARLFLNYPVTGIWRELKDSGSLEKTVELSRNSGHVLVWRRGSEVMLRELPTAESRFFADFLVDENLEQAVETAYGDSTEFDLNEFFLNLIDAGLLTSDVRPLQLNRPEKLS
ncbi:MAG: hypothetical protein DHS20C12_01970 [Pseudohongiella sp.]|nr:MAG: hypothetical protein DHS20C12_01970 [Pseudohongiella sp.]